MLSLHQRSRRSRSPLVLMRVAVTLGLGVLLLAPGESAAAANDDRPAASEHMTTAPLSDETYFIRDVHDPRVLHNAPSASDIGFDRARMQLLSRPRIDDETMDLLEDATGGRRSPPFDALVTGGPGPNAATVINGNIIVMEGSDGVAVNTANGPMFDHQGQGTFQAIQTVWQALGDQFDFITVWTAFEDPGAAGYYFPIKNDISGLGDCNFNAGDTHGCIFDQFNMPHNLSGFVFMNSVKYWENWDFQYSGTTYALTDPQSFIYAVLAQEITHKWLAAMRFIDPRNNIVSKRLLGRDNSHWASWVESRASVQDGWSWEPLEDGAFRATGLMEGFSTLDLYAMAALPSNAAEPFYFIDNAVMRAIPGWFAQQPLPAEAALQLYDPSFLTANGVNIDVDGERVDLTINDVVQAEGVRCPDPDHAQKAFRQAVVLVTAPGQSAASVGARVTELETAMATWETWFNQKTRGALTICTDAESACVHPRTEITALNASDEVAAGDTVAISVQVEVFDATAQDIVVTAALPSGSETRASLTTSSANLGSLDAERGELATLELQVNDDAACGEDIAVDVTVSSDNAASSTERLYLRVGAAPLYVADFDADANDFTFDNSDARFDGFVQMNRIETSCDMAVITPTRDASPAGKGAVVTDPAGLHEGEAIATSPVVDLAEANTPQLTVEAWVAGAGAMLDIQVAADGGDFVSVKTVGADDAGPRWTRVGVDLAEALGSTPGSVQLRFIGSGTDVEVALDEVTLRKAVGACVAADPEPDSEPPTNDPGTCQCDSSDAGAPSGMALFLGLAGMVLRRRRRA